MPTYTESDLERQYDLCQQQIAVWRQRCALALARNDPRGYFAAIPHVVRWTRLRAQVIDCALSAR